MRRVRDFETFFGVNNNWNPLITDKLGDRNLSSSSTRDLAQWQVELEEL
ncbi:MAG TPA: hypothetical protein PK147_09535 [Saprospiraceae bacterium]|nr:hypothetical protein [Saprospiraceae bacterium]